MLKLIKLTKEYKNGSEKIIALNNFTYTFNNTGFYAITGPSGSGKTTLLNILAGLDNKVLGSLIYNKKDIIKYKESKRLLYRKKEIGMIYQSPYLVPYLLTKDNISLTKKIDYELIDKLGIKRLLNRDVSKLSGGQRQRIALARALNNNPSIILADEPTGALDQNNSMKVMEVLKAQSQNKLVIMVSHDAKLCKKYCDVILTLNEGTLIKEEIINKVESIERKTKSKRIKTPIIKLALSFLKFKRKRTFLASFCCSIGLIGVMLSIILSNGFTNFFNMQFNDSLNANSIYGYPKIRENVETISIFDIQNLAIDYNLKWGVFYEGEDINFDVKYKDNTITWLNINNLFHYKLDESINIKNSNSFYLSFSRNYCYVISSLLDCNSSDETKINQHLLENDICFDFYIENNNSLMNIKLKLENIKWNDENKVEIIHNSKLWIEDLSNLFSFNIDSDLDKKGIIRYPYVYDFKEEDIENILANDKYQKITFDFDVDYGNKKIGICYYAKLNRVTKNYLEKYLLYDDILDYLYLSKNGVTSELNMPSVTMNNIKGRDISFSSIDYETLKDKYIFYGNVPKNTKEIIVSKRLFEQLKIALNSNVNIKHNFNLETKLKVVGYIEGNNANIIYQLGSWTYYFFKNELGIKNKDFPCYQIALHLKNKDNIPYYVSFLNAQHEDSEFISPLYDASKEIEKIISYFEKGVIILSTFSIFVSLLLVGIIIFLNTIEQKKYDAVFLMRGYSKNKIIRMHILQNIIISLLSFLITLFMSYFIVLEVNTVFSLMVNISYYSFANISLSTLLTLLISLLTCALISGYIPLLFLKLDDPLKILKE